MMITPLHSTKLRNEHLTRPALVYVRQSTFMQVRDNTASTTRQYDLAKRAQNLGWPASLVRVIDQDQGRSGAFHSARDGFEYLIAEVGLGRAGAVLCLEASRLARSSSDWYRLIEICALSDTLVIDEDGVYDPGQYNDRLLLGFRGTMSEAELHWLHCRLVGGKLEKAQQGTLRFRLPVGLVYDAAGHIGLDPNEEIQHAVRQVFEVFETSQSALAVVKHFADHGLQIPTRLWQRERQGEVVWRPLCHARVLSILHNPFYAGAYVYGRTKTRQRPLPGEAPRVKGYTRQVKRDDWPTLLKDHHPSYISWAQFHRHQEQLDANRTFDPEQRRGAVREGGALLQGIVGCGVCGRRMTVRYMPDGIRPIYVCAQLHKDFAGPTCQFTRGDGIDAAVAQLLLAAMEPAQLTIALEAVEHLEAQARATHHQWQLRIERARYEAERARRRYEEVEPEYRLVARSLERDWNEKLTLLDQIERDYAELAPAASSHVSEVQRQGILDLVHDLPALWQAETTTHAERKQVVRLLIKDVMLTKLETTIRVDVRWQTQACSTLEVARPKRSYVIRRTAPEVIERLRQLVRDHTDMETAQCLNDEGYRSGQGGAFTRNKVKWLRHAYGIKSGCPLRPVACPTGQRGDGRYSARAAAELLNVSVDTIADWCRSGTLDGLQMAPRGPWWVALSPEVITALRKPVRQYKPRRAKNGRPRDQGEVARQSPQA
ncbi:MAG: recombinase family protein [Candidatus Tectomicrobia bacterium]|nr:recombinase family protein [Candidatus Tectomicrobia bacterium]